MSLKNIKNEAMKILAALILITAALLFSGCANTKQQTLKEKEYVYMYSPFSDSLQGIGDTVVSFQKVIEHDTIWMAQYYPEYKTMKIKGKTDTIKIRSPADTVQKIVEKNLVTPLLSKIGLVFVGMLIGIIIIIVIVFYIKKIRR